MDMNVWIPIGIGIWIAGTAIVMFLFHPMFFMPLWRRLKVLAWFLIGVGGLILVVSFPTWLAWGHLYLRGVPVRARILSTHEEWPTDLEDGYNGICLTQVTYQFEAPVGGQPRPFQRKGALLGRYRMVSGFINVLYDRADPSYSRMTREFRGSRMAMVVSAVLLTLGWAFLRQSRRLSRSFAPAGEREHVGAPSQCASGDVARKTHSRP